MKIENRQEFLGGADRRGRSRWLVGVNFIFPPLQDWWSARQTQIRESAREGHRRQQLIKAEDRIRSHWKDMRDNALPASSSQAEQQFLKAVDGWAGESGAAITSIMPQWKNDSTNYMTLDCRVETAGDLGALSQIHLQHRKRPAGTAAGLGGT